MAKAGWLLLLIILPFLGALIYIAMRPKVTAQDVEMMTRMEAGQKAGSVGIARGSDRQAPGAQGDWRDHRARIRSAQAEGAVVLAANVCTVMIDGRPRVGHRRGQGGGPPHG